MESAFVAGATGYTGKAVVRALCEQGVACVAHVRPDAARLAEQRESLEAAGATVDTTPWEPGAMAATLARLAPTLVFALLGTTRARMKRQGAEANSYERVDYGLTVLLLDAAVAAGSAPRFVYLSAAGVTEGGNAYYQARWRAEQRIAEGPLPWLVVRPSFITGPDREERRPAERIGASVTDAVLAAAGLFGARRLRDRYTSITAGELGAAIVRLARQGGASRIVHTEELR